jgi:hypothetical protein
MSWRASSPNKNPAMAVTIRGNVPNLFRRFERWQFIESVKSFEWLLEKAKMDGN